MGKQLLLREWQKKAIERSDRNIDGIFLEALGGKGKTLAGLAICKHKKAKKVLILNNLTVILNGWQKQAKELGYEDVFSCTYMTDKKLNSICERLSELKTEQKELKRKIKDRKLYKKNAQYCKLFDEIKQIEKELTFDVMIVDEWQNMCSDKTVKNYKQIKRSYSIGLSATPIRQKGLNFYPLEKTFFNQANPNRKNSWTKYWGLMECDDYSYTKEIWKDFRDYETYISQLDSNGNFMRWEEIEAIEQSEENNGYEVKPFRPWIRIPEENLKKIEDMETLNVVEVDGEYVMPKTKFGEEHFRRYLRQAVVGISFPKLCVKEDLKSPLMEAIGGLVERATHGLLIVGNSKQVITALYQQNKENPDVGLWAGDDQVNHNDCKILLATTASVGVGVDRFQYRFKTLVALDPVEPGSGRYNDYRQLLWRIKGSRQIQDINIVEYRYLDTWDKINRYNELKKAT